MSLSFLQRETVGIILTSVAFAFDKVGGVLGIFELVATHVCDVVGEEQWS